MDTADTSSSVVYCPKCGAENKPQANFCQTCGHQFNAKPWEAGGSAARRATTEEGDATGGIIPYKNPAALIAYYLGLFALFPMIGLLLAIPAFILGIMGLRARAKNPVIKGSVHAWIGIVLGFLCTILWGGLVVMAIVASVSS